MNATVHSNASNKLTEHSQNGGPDFREDRRSERDRRFRDQRAGDGLPMPDIKQISSAAFCCDSSGAVLRHNDGAAELWGRRPNPSHLFQWCGCVQMSREDGATLPRSTFPSAMAVATGKDQDVPELWIDRPDGARRKVSAHARPLRDPASGKILGAFCMLDDETERTLLADEVRHHGDEKSAFLATLAHELRNPLAPILTAATVMRSLSSDGRILGMANIVERQAKLLARFLADLLDASRLAENGIALRPREVRLSEVLDGALDELRPKALARNQRLTINFQDRTATVFCDPERTSQAMANVMLNASSFTSDGGNIAARARIRAGELAFEVEDTGMGIDPADMEQLFEPYVQFEPLDGRMRSGAGLGLSIAKAICEKQGGKISASSEGRGKGSTFRIVLPIAISQR